MEKMSNHARKWLSTFRLMNLELRLKLDGRPLYCYQVTYSEFQDLERMLQTNRLQVFHGDLVEDWSACFCLYVAEVFRREYDANEGGWSWELVWSRLGYNFPTQQYQQIVEVGMLKWRRPIRKTQHGRSFLGSLFAEGGLPWRLVQSEIHGFGVLVRRGLNNYYLASATGKSLTELISEVDYRLPQTFRNTETYLLLAGVVKQLIILVETYPLQNQENPALFLDKANPTWRSDFPLPLDETNARSLINDWLKRADEQHKKHIVEKQEIKDVYCSHAINERSQDWTIVSTVYLPKSIPIPLVNIEKLTSTRFEMAFYEGDKLIKKAGVVYGEIHNGQIILHLTTAKVDIIRRDLNEVIKLRFLENGYFYHTLLVEQSSLNQHESPLVFELQGDTWVFVQQASCRVKGELARVSMPPTCQLINSVERVIHTQANGIRWVEIADSISILDGIERYSVKLRQSCLQTTLRLEGAQCLYETIPSVVYHGIPNLVQPNDVGSVPENLSIDINGVSINKHTQLPQSTTGSAYYRVRNQLGETVYKRYFGILPKGFSIRSFPATERQTARIVITQAAGLPITISEASIKYEKVESNQSVELLLSPKNINEIPLSLTLCVGTPNSDVKIILPYPHEGVCLIDQYQQRVTKRDLSPDELLGLQLVLTSAKAHQQGTTINFSLIRQSGQPLKRSYRVPNYETSVQISLFSYQDDILQMLSAIDDPDAYIRVTIEQDRLLLQFNIRRYQVVLAEKDRFTWVIQPINTVPDDQSITLFAMRLANPQQHALLIHQKLSQGVGVGEYEIPAELEREGPWLVYSSADSQLKCRPYLHVSQNDKQTISDSIDVKSLHQAAAKFHPVLQPQVIHDQIKELAEDLNHSGWEYLTDLKKNYSHLPLSTFEAWRSLAREPKALALALFRLELDTIFCERIQNELAVLWETIPISLWLKSYITFTAWLVEKGLPQTLIDDVLNYKKSSLQKVVSGFDYLNGYIQNQNVTVLQAAPIRQVLPCWYQELRRQHMQDSQWPTDLGIPLKSWINQQSLPIEIKELSKITYTDAVTYLPIFMAYVSVGFATLQDLKIPLPTLKFYIKLITDFDRAVWYTPVHSMMVCYLLATPKHIHNNL